MELARCKYEQSKDGFDRNNKVHTMNFAYTLRSEFAKYKTFMRTQLAPIALAAVTFRKRIVSKKMNHRTGLAIGTKFPVLRI
jgi:hypothetical protein